MNSPATIALAGNPNVGKSTLFNALTGLRQHTGNWPGKTVSSAQGRCVHRGQPLLLVDLPGTYSLSDHSPEERVARDFIESGAAALTLVVCDATNLERTLLLALQILERTTQVVVCVNLLDEARRHGLQLQLPLLARELGVPVVGISAGRREGLDTLLDTLCQQLHTPSSHPPRPAVSPCQRAGQAHQYATQVVQCCPGPAAARQRRLDRLLTTPATGLPLMLLLLGLVLWLTMVGANGPSLWLSALFARLGEHLTRWLAPAPLWLSSLLMDGLYRVLTWVVAVMLPPMAIFFPLFTLLEDLGYLPRVAFLMDRAFQRAGACGKQMLTTCMSLGCNACGLMGCRIIDSPRERLLAMLTAPLMPCNGKFPTLIALITLLLPSGMLATTWSALLLMGVLALSMGATLLSARLLSATLLKGVPSSFILELPPYRRPRVGEILLRSVLDRTLFVLGRAVAVAAPAGLLLWVLAHVELGGLSLLDHFTRTLDPLGRLLGMDGVILAAFILGWPAHEIVLPILLMSYLSAGTLVEVQNLTHLLTQQGWTWLTVVCTLLFSLFHWPCSTTCLTLYRESGSVRWTVTAMVLPTALGAILCALLAAVVRLTGLL